MATSDAICHSPLATHHSPFSILQPADDLFDTKVVENSSSAAWNKEKDFSASPGEQQKVLSVEVFFI